MAACAYCGAETELYENGVPICLKCSDEREAKRKPTARATEIRAILHDNLIQATKRTSEALQQFEEAANQYPSALPPPDGVQRIKNASNALAIARKEMATAYNRLDDYLGRGIVPDDLKAHRMK